MTFIKKPLAIIIASLVVGCSNTDNIASNEENNRLFDQQSNRISGEFDFDTDRRIQEPFRYEDDFFVLGGAFEMVERQSLPSVFDVSTSFGRVDDMTIDELIDRLNKKYQQYGVVINLDNEAREHISSNLSSDGEDTSSSNDAGSSDSTGIIPIATIDSQSLNASSAKSGYRVNFNLSDGSLRQALDLITANTNTWWKFADGRATIYRFDQETFLLDTGDQSYQNTFEQAGSASSDDTTVGSKFVAEGEDVKPLEQIESQIGLMLSSDGKVMVNRFDKTVTVKDTPPVLKKVRSFLDDMNFRATTTYGVVVDVFEIVTEVNDNRGVDWEAVFQTNGNKFGFESPSFIPDPTSGGLDIEVSVGNWNIDAIFSLLNQNASIYSYIQKSSKTKNNIPTLVTSIDDRALVAGRSVTINSDGFSQESIETKLIDEGFAVTTRPRLTSKGRIDMEVVVSTKVIKDVKNFGNDENEVQLEETRRQNAKGNIVMRDGDHAIVSAYERMLTAADVSSLTQQFPWWTGGKSEKRRFKSNLIVVVKPTIMER